MKYRSEIDGLRAVAVVPVILFHAGLPGFSGGFVGVDVFFVISGYLITGILLADLQSDRFSILRFYERRARRILPALFVVILACIPFAWMWMLPSQLKDFGESVLAVVVFASNILFWREDDYFSGDAELKPLLHTWSLAVEEQFYVLFPIVLYLLWRFWRSKQVPVLILAALASFALCEWAARHEPSANFYLSPTRAWELLAGSLCAHVATLRVSRAAAEGLSLAGLALILVPVFLFDEMTPFPSHFALAPVVGTSMVILFAGRETLAGRLLSTRPFVGIGLISYSAYLWHQPLFAFARLRLLGEPGHLVMLGLSLAALALAVLTWRFVEQPFRRPSHPALASRNGVFLASGIAGAVLAGIGLAGHYGNGFPARSNGELTYGELDTRIRANLGLSDTCEGRFTTSPDCATGEPPEFVVWGDSFAMHLVPGLVAAEPGLKLRQHTKSACAPILGLSMVDDRHSIGWARGCIAFNDAVLEWLKTAPETRVVVLSSPLRILRMDLVGRDGNRILAGEREAAIRAGLVETVRQIRDFGARVVFVSGPPSLERNIGQCLSSAAFLRAPKDACDFPLESIRNADIYRFLDSVEQDVPVFWLRDLICAEGICDTMLNGKFLYRDKSHLSIEGSAELGQAHRWPDLIRELAR